MICKKFTQEERRRAETFGKTYPRYFTRFGTSFSCFLAFYLFLFTYKLPNPEVVEILLARAYPSERPSLLPVCVSLRTCGQMFDTEIHHLQIKRYCCKTRSVKRSFRIFIFFYYVHAKYP